MIQQWKNSKKIGRYQNLAKKWFNQLYYEANDKEDKIGEKCVTFYSAS